VTDLIVKDEGDRRTAVSMSAFFHSELGDARARAASSRASST
jgi:hypothetical protein